MLRGQERVVVDNPKLTGPPIKDLGFEKKEQEEKQAKEAAADAEAAKKAAQDVQK
jgi:hypothetical protein